MRTWITKAGYPEAAIKFLLQDVRARSRDAEEDDERPSLFDAPEAEPSCVFVNPFACGVSPLQWRELQAGFSRPCIAA